MAELELESYGEETGITVVVRMDPSRDVDWAKLGRWLASQSSERQAELLIAFIAQMNLFPYQIEYLVQDLQAKAPTNEDQVDVPEFLQHLLNSWETR